MSGAILWVVPKWPFPCEDGARRATVQQLRGLCRSRRPIDLLALAAADERCEEEEAKRRLGVRAVHVIRNRARGEGVVRYLRLLRSLVTEPRVPVTLARYADRKTRRAFAQLLRQYPRRWDVVVFDGLHAAAPLSNGLDFHLPQEIETVIYRAHNVEADLWIKAAHLAGQRPRGWLLRYQAARIQRFERSLLARASEVVPMSIEDERRFRILQPDVRATFIPIGVEFRAPEPPPSATQIHELLFLGRLDWPPNRQGLEWFLNLVWPAVAAARGDLLLTIAGSGDSRWLSRFANLERLQFLGRVDDVTALYRRATVALVPVFFGSGVRVKVLEAAQFGRVCLSTELGVTGSCLRPHETYLRAETKDEWIRALVELEAGVCARLGCAAHRFIRKNFASARVEERFRSTLDRAVSNSTTRPPSARRRGLVSGRRNLTRAARHVKTRLP